MSMLVCPHCGARMKTMKAVASGSRVTCPRCSHAFGIGSSGEHLVEEILVAKFEDIYGDVAQAPAKDSVLPPRRGSGSSSGETEVPRRLKRDEPTAKASAAAPKKEQTLESSRTFVVGAGALVLLILAAIIGRWYLDQVDTLNRNVDKASAALKTKNERFIKNVVASVPGKEKQEAKLLTDLGGRTLAPEAKQLGSVQVSVVSARIGEVTTKSKRTLPGPYLVLTLRITNLSPAEFLYKGWDKGVVLRDSNGNYYNTIPPTEGDPFADSQVGAKLAQSRSVLDVMVFEDTSNAGFLELDMPSFSGENVYQFRLGPMFVKRDMVTFKMATPGFTTPPPAPPTPPPPGFQNPPSPPVAVPDDAVERQLRNDILFQWRAEVAKIDRTSRGKGTADEARRYRRTGRDQLARKLAKQYGVEEFRIRQIVGG
jgi:hypothetical protein